MEKSIRTQILELALKNWNGTPYTRRQIESFYTLVTKLPVSGSFTWYLTERFPYNYLTPTRNNPIYLTRIARNQYVVHVA